MKVAISRNWVVRAGASVVVRAPAGVVWGQMRDVEWFLTRDPLHARVRRTDGAGMDQTWAGAPVVVSHRVLGVGPDRVGRVLAWKEGRGFAVSDLSRRGTGVGFPHVCAFRVEPIDAKSSRVVLSVRGRWTARWMPRIAVGMWLRWVLGATEARLAGDLADLAAWRARRAGTFRPTTEYL